MAVASLPLRPPLAPMLARLVRELPIGDYVYEPKWDGFRAIIFRDGDEVDIQSRHERPMARYFPELVAAVRMLPVERIVGRRRDHRRPRRPVRLRRPHASYPSGADTGSPPQRGGARHLHRLRPPSRR